MIQSRINFIQEYRTRCSDAEEQVDRLRCSMEKDQVFARNATCFIIYKYY